MVASNSQDVLNNTDSELVRSLTDFFNKLNQNQPYNINIIDELHANENAHSRIMGKLLAYCNSTGEYSILKSILNYIVNVKEKNEFKVLLDELISQNLTIENEKERIDLLVKGDDYAIIFENKIKGAGDQQNQIARYIEKLLANDQKKYQERNVYVVYLTSDEHNPSDQSWKIENGRDYKNDFEDRYVNLSYKSDILPWIKSEVYPSCPIKEELLISALRQYIDHLEGMFWMRSSQQESGMLPKLLKVSKYESHGNELKNVYELLCKLREIQNQSSSLQPEDIVVLDSVKNILENYINSKIRDINIVFEQKSREILNLEYGQSYGNVEIEALLNGSDKRLLFAFPEKWRKALRAVHLEWVNLKENHYVGEGAQEYFIELHFEQNTWKKYYDSVKDLIKLLSKELTISNKSGKTICGISIKAPSLCYMTDKKLYDFLTEAYNKIGSIVVALSQIRW